MIIYEYLCILKVCSKRSVTALEAVLSTATCLFLCWMSKCITARGGRWM